MKKLTLSPRHLNVETLWQIERIGVPALAACKSNWPRRVSWCKRKTQAETDPGQASRRAQAAKLRAAREREERIREALEQLPEVAAAKRRNAGKAEDARASTTDADARVMKMADGGFRPAYNVQFATTCDSQVIVGMAVVNAGSDMAQLGPMVEQLEQRLGQAPEQWLVDGGFPAHEQIDAVAGKTELYAPVPKSAALIFDGVFDRFPGLYRT